MCPCTNTYLPTYIRSARHCKPGPPYIVLTVRQRKLNTTQRMGLISWETRLGLKSYVHVMAQLPKQIRRICVHIPPRR